MKLFFQSLLLASVTAFSFSPTIQAIEINHLNYCSVTVAQPDGNNFTILVPKINLSKIVRQLEVIDIDCDDSANPQPLF